MKKFIIILAVIILVLSINKEEKVIIPKDSIRFRVVANSNKDEDQLLKKEIVKNLSDEINNIEKSNSIEETRTIIKKGIPKFTEVVEKTIKDNNSNNSFNINYGKNYFPRKEYKNVIYEEGDYESLVINIGEGNGKNFWCVLFPPICMIDKESDNEYKSFIKEVIEKYF